MLSIQLACKYSNIFFASSFIFLNHRISIIFFFSCNVFDCIQMQMNIWTNSENVYKHFHPKLLILIFEHYFWQKFEAFTFRINHSYMFLCILAVNRMNSFVFSSSSSFFPSFWFAFFIFHFFLISFKELWLTGYSSICFFLYLFRCDLWRTFIFHVIYYHVLMDMFGFIL